ncbi:MAG: hypothetical protein IT363_00640 [Methanoregulaceae archaeon]|nr:hypothetical protein [Methanoregulaceae archaeon]
MSEQRRGPDYVPARMIERKRARARRYSWLLVPIVGVGLAYVVVSSIQNQQESEAQFRSLRRSLRGPGEFHSVEYRVNGEQETVLREDWVGTDRRRIEYFDGQFIIYHFSLDGKSEDMVHEPGAGVVRRHHGAVLLQNAIERLANEMSDRNMRASRGPGGRLVLETSLRKHVVEVDEESGRPTAWQTSYFTDEGEKPLSRTVISYGGVDRTKLDYDAIVKRTKPVDVRDLQDANRIPKSSVATIGGNPKPFLLASLDVNQSGDIFYIYRSPYERPFIEVTADGGVYSRMDVTTATPDVYGYSGEQLAIRVQDAPVRWPLTVKVTVRADARYVEGMTTGQVLGTYTRTFERPTCFMAPVQWFGEPAADGPLYDYLRTRHYRLALIYQNMMRAPDGRMVDTISGGLSTMEDTPNLRKDPADLRVALEHARETLRVRTEYDAGRISVWRIYILIAEIHMALDQRDLASRAISFARRLSRETRGNGFPSGEVERAAKLMGL